jgi:hypothetical protein
MSTFEDNIIVMAAKSYVADQVRHMTPNAEEYYKKMPVIHALLEALACAAYEAGKEDSTASFEEFVFDRKVVGEGSINVWVTMRDTALSTESKTAPTHDGTDANLRPQYETN